MTTTTPHKIQRWTALRTPEVERLTPDRLTDKHRSSSESLDSNTTQNVVSLLRLPVALTELLNVPSELVDTETLSLFLSRRSLSDRYQLLDVLEKLYQYCSNLCADHQKTPRSTPTPLPRSGNEPENCVEAQPEYPSKIQRVYSKSNTITASSSNQPEDELENNFIDDTPSPIEFEEHTLSSNTEAAYENLGRNELGDQDLINPIAIRKGWDSPKYEIDNMFKCTSSAASSSGTEDSAQSALVRETIENPSTLRDLPVVQLRTPLKTPLKRHDRVPPEDNLTTSYDQPIRLIIAQSTTEFARSSLEEIEQLQFPIDSAETYKNLFHSLKATSQAQAIWSSGSEWRSIVESGFAERHKSSIRYALTAITFARWHRDQADLLSSSSPTAAAQEVSSRILGPVPKDVNEKRVREIRRKRLTTHLTRGRIWDELVSILGFGILFKDAWNLAKSKKHIIKDLISQLQNDLEKMNILKVLEKQMDKLLENGQTNPVAFRQALENQGLLGTSMQTLDISKEVISLQKDMKISAPSNMLLVKSTGFHFNIETLNRLNGTEWFNDELILLCLHLADKLPYVRVGFSVPVHQQDRPRKMVAKPFERAAQVIEEWKNADPDQGLVCLFPLFQHGDHFSLLEVNYKDDAIYHYDSLKKATRTEIKKACKDQFPGLQYIEQTAPHQLDTFSCGPLVVTSAYYRMLGRTVISGDVTLQDATATRATALSLITTAWRDNILIPVEQSTGRKRGRESVHQRQGKRQKTDKPVQVENLTI